MKKPAAISVGALMAAVIMVCVIMAQVSLIGIDSAGGRDLVDHLDSLCCLAGGAFPVPWIVARAGEIHMSTLIKSRRVREMVCILSMSRYFEVRCN